MKDLKVYLNDDKTHFVRVESPLCYVHNIFQFFAEVQRL